MTWLVLIVVIGAIAIATNAFASEIRASNELLRSVDDRLSSIQDAVKDWVEDERLLDVLSDVELKASGGLAALIAIASQIREGQRGEPTQEKLREANRHLPNVFLRQSEIASDVFDGDDEQP